MMPPNFGLHDPKKLTQTVELDYFQRPRPFRRVKRSLLAAAFLASSLLVVLSLLPHQRTAYQSAPVSTAHAMFNQDCGICHPGAFRPFERFIRHDSSFHSVTDETCIKCHAGSHHHPPLALARGCADCHREHRGRAVLAHVPNGRCTLCHADIKSVKPDSVLENVADLSTHPEFGLWGQNAGGFANPAHDPGTIHFNHAKHLHLPEKDALRGIDAPLARLREQQCAACHQTDVAGRYMLPVRYEQHCQSCHPLLIQVGAELTGTKLLQARQAFARKPLLHPAPLADGKERGQGAATVRALVRDRYLEFVRLHPEVLAKSAVTADPEHGRLFPGTRRSEPANRDQVAWAEQQLLGAERLLFDGADGCRRCHQEAARSKGLPDYAEPAMLLRWLARSRFKHASHRMLNCLECHPQAETSTQSKDVLMPKIADCRQCHKPQGGARSDCFECHNFHQRGSDNWHGNMTIKAGRERQGP
jgi:hypothetical protein